MSSAEPDFSAIHPSTSARTDGDNIGLDNRGSTGIDLGDNSRNFVTSQRGVGPWGPDQWMQQNDLQPDQCMNMYLLHNDLATCSVQPAPRYGSLHSYSERPHAPAQSNNNSAYGAPVSSHVHTFDARIANHGDMHLSLGKPQYGINASTPATFQSSQGQSQGYSPMAQVPLGMDMLTSPAHGAPDPGPSDAGTTLYSVSVKSWILFDVKDKEKFNPKTIQKIGQKYGITYEKLFYYFRVVDDVDCVCPIADCTLEQTTFRGHAIQDHLDQYHPNITTWKEKVVCARMSNRESKCQADNEVQGKYFLKHFREIHLDAHGRCPFCDGRVGRVHNFKIHFAKCPKLK